MLAFRHSHIIANKRNQGNSCASNGKCWLKDKVVTRLLGIVQTISSGSSPCSLEHPWVNSHPFGLDFLTEEILALGNLWSSRHLRAANEGGSRIFEHLWNFTKWIMSDRNTIFQRSPPLALLDTARYATWYFNICRWYASLSTGVRVRFQFSEQSRMEERNYRGALYHGGDPICIH